MKKSAGRDACGFDCEKCDLRPATEYAQNTDERMKECDLKIKLKRLHE